MPMSAPVALSLVICTRNRAPQLARMLASLKTLTCAQPWEIVVVDNGSTDNTQAVIEAFRAETPASLTVVVEARPGTGHAHNCGWQTAQGEIVSFTDDDCYPAPDFLQMTQVCFATDPQLGFLGGRVLLHDPADYKITVQENTARHDFAPGAFIAPGLILGANNAFRRAALMAINGFDPAFGAGTPFPCEDVDVLARISAAGWRGAYDPRPLVYHAHGRKTVAQADRLMRSYDYGRGAYFAKCLLQPALRRTYARNWWWRIKAQPLAMTGRELWAAAAYYRYRLFKKQP